ncbi:MULTISPECIES: hypothetical protein [Corynebacterium]|uniref:hypothetical protein n=1 Tax=Corynebacterium TaxID=1716 RepID=UPI0008AA48E1|nr:MULTISPECIES: hypothetical protein [Corynebacterium]MDK8664733.1 hypothetical protein [Corynebacterium coyleae]MDK8707734.1 hypothetical protein [Corynebacterium coyleae]MDK8734675.1 hypothetical protein [Corynebacterium coyleae]MDK8893849.1 hypothetical protein [Corynebacterium coyleae]OHO31322.1 hypothetical protein HMPREF2656_10250 [Corynebacterium sp. HMSC034B08]
MLFREAIEQLNDELGVVDNNYLSPQREERLLRAYLNAVRSGKTVTNAEAKREFLEIFEEPIYFEENFYSPQGVLDAFELARTFGAMEPVVSLKLPSLEEMDLYRRH